jgi:hypothetical protein
VGRRTGGKIRAGGQVSIWASGHTSRWADGQADMRADGHSYNSLRVPSSSSTGEHAMRDGTWQGKGGKVGVRVNGAEVFRDI